MKYRYILFVLGLGFLTQGLQAEEKKEVTKKWKQSLSLGVNLTEGNNDTFLFNTKYDAEKTKKKSKLTYGLQANFGTENDEQTTNNYGAKAQYNRNFSGRGYWLATFSYDIDKIADLDRRLMVGPGLGYQVIKKDSSQLNFEAGIGYLSEKFDGVSAEDDLALRLAETWNCQLSKTSSLWQSAEFLTNADETSDYILKAELGVESQLSSKFNIKSFVQNTTNNKPAAGKKKNDLSFVTMLVYSF